MQKSAFFIVCLLHAFLSFSQSVTPTASLNEARWGHQSQLLNNGHVLVFGGDNHKVFAPQRFASAELYNPATKTWAFTGRMAQERSHFSSVLLNDGNVLAIGGLIRDDFSLASCELYQAATGTWQSVTGMAMPRAGHAAVKLRDGRVLVAGGYGGRTAELYDPVADAWTGAGNLEQDHGPGLAMALLDDGKVLATGGEFTPTWAEIFDPQTMQWSRLPFPTARHHYYHSMVRLPNGNFLLVGTQAAGTEHQVSAELYHPATQTFSTTGNLLTNAGIAPMVPLDNGSVLRYGLGDPFSPANTKCIQLYNPGTGTWSAGAYNFIGANWASANLLHDGTVLLAGGSWTTGNGASSTCFLVNQNAFPACAAPSVALAVHGSTACNGTPATVSLPVTEAGVSYQAHLAGQPVGGVLAGGGALTLALPADRLALGRNIVKIRALKPGCPGYFLTDTARVTVTLPAMPRPVATAGGPTVLCAGGSVELAGPAGMAGYEWSTGETTQKIRVSATGHYRVRVKNAAGCSSAYSEAVAVNVSPRVIFAGENYNICADAGAQPLTGYYPQGGTWSGNGVSAAGVFDPAAAGPGSHDLTYSICHISSTRTMHVTPVARMNNFVLKADADTLCYQQDTDLWVSEATPAGWYELWKGTTRLERKFVSGTLFSFDTGILTDDAQFTVKGVYANGCGADSLSKTINVRLHVNPHRPVGAKTPFVCKRSAGRVYVAASQRNVYYQLKKGIQKIGPERLGNGDTLFLDTGPLTETTMFSVVGTKANCSQSLFGTATIQVAGPDAHFTVSSYNVEAGQPLEIRNTSRHAGGGCAWNFGAGASVAASTAQHLAAVTYATPGTYTIRLTCRSLEGCVDTISRTFNVIRPVTAAACDYTVSSGEMAIGALAVAWDAQENSFLLFDKAFSSSHYSPRGDSLPLKMNYITDYNTVHTLVKYNPRGTIQWATYLRHGSDWSQEGDMLTDSLGNVYFAYYHADHSDSIRAYSTDGSYVTFDPPHSGWGTSVVVLKYDKDGIFQWYNTYLEHYTNHKVALALDKNLNVYCTSENSLNKFGPGGETLWSRPTGYYDVEVDSRGNVWGVRVTGLVVDKYDAAGNLVLSSREPAKVGQAPLYINARYLKLDAGDNAYLLGSYAGEFVFRKDTLSNVNMWNEERTAQFLCKINRDGTPAWIRQMKGDHVFGCLGMSLKKDQIIFAGNAGQAVISYNALPGGGFASHLPVRGSAHFVGLTDTSATGKTKMTVIVDGLYAFSGAAREMVAFSRQSDRVLLTVPFSSGRVLGRPVARRYLSDYQQDLVTMRATLDCLFPPVPPLSQFRATGTACAGAAVPFSDASGGEPGAWNWHFPGGIPQTSTAQNPVVTFPNPGVYLVSLTATNAFGVGSTFTDTLVVTAAPVVTITPGAVCKGASVTLMASGAVFYNWENGVTGPYLTLPPLTRDTLVTVKVKNATGCVSSVTHTVRVNPAPAVNIPADLGPLCADAGPVALPAATPAGGSYHGLGVRDGSFDPSLVPAGRHRLTYTYTSPDGCTGFDTTDVVVHPRPDVRLVPLDTLCTYQEPIALYGWPAGGAYGGTGVTNGAFDPRAAGPGTFRLTYTYRNAAGCTAVAGIDVVVRRAPDVQLPYLLPVCRVDEPRKLEGPGYPAGGTYSGPGLINGWLNPAGLPAGTHPITYTYTDPDGCTGSATANLVVTELPAVTLLPPVDLCADQSPVPLRGGSPAGGAYSGPGVTADGLFDPRATGPGKFRISYRYAGENGCQATADTVVMVNVCTGMAGPRATAALRVYPNPGKGKFVVAFEPVAGAAAQLTVYDGQGKMVARKAVAPGAGEAEIDLRGRAGGMYHLQLTRGSRVVAGRNVLLQ